MSAAVYGQLATSKGNHGTQQQLSVSEKAKLFEMLANSTIAAQHQERAEDCNSNLLPPHAPNLRTLHISNSLERKNITGTATSAKQCSKCTDCASCCEPSTGKKSCPTPPPPVKPKRTFKHDNFNEATAASTRPPVAEPRRHRVKNANNDSAIPPKRPISRPTSKPPPPPDTAEQQHIYGEYLSSAANDSESSGSKPAANVIKPCPYPRPKQFAPVPRQRRPAAARIKTNLSHEYEQIYRGSSCASNTLKRHASDEEIYARPVDSCSDDYVRGAQLTVLSCDPLYYDSATVVRRPAMLTQRHPVQALIDRIKQKAGPKRERRNSGCNMPKIQRFSKLILNCDPSPTESTPPSEIASKLAHSNSSRSMVTQLPSPGVDCSAADNWSTRAKLIRRKTILYEQGVLAFKQRKDPRLFILCALIKLEEVPSRPDAPKSDMATPKFKPVLKYRYPRVTNTNEAQENDLLRDLPMLCYPDCAKFGGENSGKFFTGDQQFVMALTDESGQRKFAYCYRFLPSGLCLNNNDRFPEVICLLSPLRARRLYEAVLEEAVSRTKVNWDLAKEFLQHIYRTTFPVLSLLGPMSMMALSSPGAVDSPKQQHQFFPSDNWILSVNQEPETLCHGVASALKTLGADKLLKIVSALVAERRVLLIAGDLSTLSKTLHAVCGLLWPFEWPHTLIPVIPDQLVYLCHSPFPYLIGVLRDSLVLHQLKPLLLDDDQEGILIVDFDYSEVVRDKGFLKGSSAVNSRETEYRDFPPKFLSVYLKCLKEALNSDISHSVTTAAGESILSDSALSELFILLWGELIGHYRAHIARQQDRAPVFQYRDFVEAPGSESVRKFLSWFVNTGMFQTFCQTRLDASRAGSAEGCLEDPFVERWLELRRHLVGKQHPYLLKLRSLVSGNKLKIRKKSIDSSSNFVCS